MEHDAAAILLISISDGTAHHIDKHVVSCVVHWSLYVGRCRKSVDFKSEVDVVLLVVGRVGC